MRYHIWKEFHFSASHQLTHLAPGHPCARLHGHNYVVEIELASDTLNENGFVLDYNALKPFKEWIDARLDHRHLNDVLDGPHHTTAEHLAVVCFQQAMILIGHAVRVVACRVRETPKTCAEYRP